MPLPSWLSSPIRGTPGTLLVYLLVASPSLAVVIDPKDIDAENARLSSLGYDLHGQSFISADAYALPPAGPRPFVAPTEWFELPRPKTVQADDLAKDLELLRYAMEKQYVFWDKFKANGFDWDRFFDGWKEKLQSHTGERLDVDEAFAPFYEFKSTHIDNHTSVYVDSDPWLQKSHSLSAALVGEPQGMCTSLVDPHGKSWSLGSAGPAGQPYPVRMGSSNRRFSKMKKGYAVSWPVAWGEQSKIVCGDTRLDLIADWDVHGEKRREAALQLAGLTEDRPSYKRSSSDIGLLRFPTMTEPHVADYRKLAEDVTSLSDGNEKVLIVDVRGDMGGDGDLVMGVLRRWIKDADIEAARSRTYLRCVQRTSCLSDSFEWGLNGVALQTYLSPDPSDHAVVQSLIDALYLPYDRSCPVGEKSVEGFMSSDGPSDYASHVFDPSNSTQMPLVLVVMDNLCASGCDGLIQELAAYPRVLLAGVSTSGTYTGSHPGYFVLPNTKITFRMSMWFSSGFKDDRSIDGYGFYPEILLNTRDNNSPKAILDLARSLVAADVSHGHDGVKVP